MNSKFREEFHVAFINNDLSLVDKMISDIPLSVIKFFNGSYNGDENIYLDAVKNNSLWVSSPKLFNDPFDCVINIDFEYEAYQAFLEKLHYFFDEESADIILKKFKEDKAGYDGFRKFIAYDYRMKAKRFTDFTYVSCFSEPCNLKSLRMWGHYANSHRGFCLEYSTYEIFENEKTIYEPGYIEFLPVCYSNDYSVYKGSRNDHNAKAFLSSMAYVKSREWEYENEWRLAVFDKKHIGLSGFLIPFLSPIRAYLGCKIDERLKEDLLSICKPMDISVYQAYMKPNSYNIGYKKITG